MYRAIPRLFLFLGLVYIAVFLLWFPSWQENDCLWFPSLVVLWFPSWQGMFLCFSLWFYGFRRCLLFLDFPVVMFSCVCFSCCFRYFMVSGCYRTAAVSPMETVISCCFKQEKKKHNIRTFPYELSIHIYIYIYITGIGTCAAALLVLTPLVRNQRERSGENVARPREAAERWSGVCGRGVSGRGVLDCMD